MVSACIAEILLAYAACASVGARGRLALQEHGGYRNFWARLLRVLLLLDGLLVCKVSLKWVGGISSGVVGVGRTSSLG